MGGDSLWVDNMFTFCFIIVVNSIYPLKSHHYAIEIIQDWIMEETFPFQFTLKYYIFSLFGLIASLLDIVLDILTVVSFYQDGAYVYLGVMIFLLVGSSVLVQVFSWYFYSDSLDNLQTNVEKYVNRHHLLKAFHVMQLGVYLRYAGLLEISTRRFLQTDRFQEDVAVNLNHDLYLLRLFEAFSENAPQLTLMMSRIAVRQDLELFTGLKTLVAFAAIALSVVAYHQSMREFSPGKQKLNWTLSVFYFLWNVLFIVPRVTALALFTSVFPCYITAHFLCEWVVLVLMVWSQKTNFMEGSCWEWLYRATVGLIWYFSWFNVGSGNTRLKSAVYYTLMGLDTMVLLGFWWWKMEHVCVLLLKPYIIIVILASLYVLGIFLRIIYYKIFHPNCEDITIIGESHESVDSCVEQHPACFGLKNTASPQEVLPETPTQPVTGAERRRRIMAANFYL